MEKELHSNIAVSVALASAVLTTGINNGLIIDTKDYESLEFIIQSGTVTDGTHDVKIEESDDSGMVGATDVTADELLGLAKQFGVADDDVAHRIGSIGKKRYQRLVITSAGTTTGGVFAATAVQGHPKHAPIAD